MHAALHRTSIFEPLRQPRCRAIWAANLLSNLGTWGQAFAAAWHVAALSGSAATAALVKTATWAPMLLFALPAGLLADCVHKPSRQSVRYRRLVLHTACIYGAANALPALLRGARAQAAGFGLLMGALGGGAVLASVLLPALRRRFAQPRLLAGALLLYGAMLALVVPLTAPGLRAGLIACGGMAWAAIVTTLNRAALTAFPAALRSRTLSAYIFMAAAGQALGGVLWGQLAGRFGIPAALACAAVVMLACAASISHFPHLLDDA
jgi:hypothetical protein